MRRLSQASLWVPNSKFLPLSGGAVAQWGLALRTLHEITDESLFLVCLRSAVNAQTPQRAMVREAARKYSAWIEEKEKAKIDVLYRQLSDPVVSGTELVSSESRSLGSCPVERIDFKAGLWTRKWTVHLMFVVDGGDVNGARWCGSYGGCGFQGFGGRATVGAQHGHADLAGPVD